MFHYLIDAAPRHDIAAQKETQRMWHRLSFRRSFRRTHAQDDMGFILGPTELTPTPAMVFGDKTMRDLRWRWWFGKPDRGPRDTNV